MREVVLSIPEIDREQNIEIEVKINGRKKTLNYRVEILAWEKINPESESKIDTIRHFIKDRDKDWGLVQIGVPDNGTIPIMFKRKN